MRTKWYTAMFAMISSYLVTTFSPYAKLIGILVIVMSIDYVSGVMCGYKNKELSSKKGFKGIAKKVQMILIVGAACLTSTYIFQDGEWVANAVIMYYVSNEFLSIIENSSILGVKYPKFLKKALEQVRNDKDDPEQEV